jgi:hypothetical protein
MSKEEVLGRYLLPACLHVEYYLYTKGCTNIHRERERERGATQSSLLKAIAKPK